MKENLFCHKRSICKILYFTNIHNYGINMAFVKALSIISIFRAKTYTHVTFSTKRKRKTKGVVSSIPDRNKNNTNARFDIYS